MKEKSMASGGRAGRILLVDDEQDILWSFQNILYSEGYQDVLTESDSREVLALLERNPVDVIFLDISMPHVKGDVLLKDIAYHFPGIPVVMLTAVGSIEIAVECMKNGAFDFMLKPVDRSRFLSGVEKALEIVELRRQANSLKQYLLEDKFAEEEAFRGIITRNRRMLNLFKYIETIAASPQAVLVLGETGTGKEMLARSIHDASRRKGEFVAVNVAGLDDTMFSDTLFGHRKGAFTGADSMREGLVSRAEGGTLFLDEIGDLGEMSQTKLLRLLQEREYYPLGADIPKKTNVRIVVATNVNLQEKMANNTFRKDLFYRLRTHQVVLPPLRERKDDIPLLVEHFVNQAASSMGKPSPRVSPQVYPVLQAYAFPGNIRELESIIYDTVARVQDGVIRPEHMQGGIRSVAQTVQEEPEAKEESRSAVRDMISSFDHFPSLREMEDLMIEEALRLSDDRQGAAAALLGITRQGLNKRLNKRKDDKEE